MHWSQHLALLKQWQIYASRIAGFISVEDTACDLAIKFITLQSAGMQIFAFPHATVPSFTHVCILSALTASSKSNTPPKKSYCFVTFNKINVGYLHAIHLRHNADPKGLGGCALCTI